MNIDSWIADVLRRDNNAISILKSYAESLNSNTAVIEYINVDGSVSSYTIPSLSGLLSTIDRIDNTIKNLSSVGLAQASIKLPNGDKRVIMTVDIATTPAVVTLQPQALQYNVRNDINTGIVPTYSIRLPKSESVLVNVITIPESYDNDVYDYNELIQSLQSKSLPYHEHVRTYKVNPLVSDKTGTFDVTDINIIDNVHHYTLNTIKYKSSDGVSIISVGDVLVINATHKSSTVAVDSVNITTNTITVKSISGSDDIIVGESILSIVPTEVDYSIVDVDIPINATIAIFARIINNGIINPYWGTGIAFNTIKLIGRDNNSIKTLLKSEPKINAITPLAPVLHVDNFVVRPINKHKIDTDRSKVITKNAEKEHIRSNINTIDDKIRILKGKLSNESNNIVRTKLLNEIDSSILERKKLVTSYSSVVTDLTAILKEYSNYKPKYRIRGFFDIPNGQYLDADNKIGYQDIIKFECEYRYLKHDSSVVNADVLSYKDKNGNDIVASYSSWNNYNLGIRPKRYNKDTNTYQYESEDLTNPDVINVNQVDIPITSHEVVEIRVRSISEVGYPNVITKSNWSNVVTIKFPDQYVDDPLNISIDLDKMLSRLEGELTALGLYDHLSDSIISGDKRYHHSARNIATDQYTDDNKQLSVEQVINNLRLEVNKINAQYNGLTSLPIVTLLDDTGKVITTINNNDVVNVFAGYYKDIVKQYTNAKGEIITKTYYISIKNPNATDMELLSYVPGLHSTPIPYRDHYRDYVINKYEYDNYRRYHNTPISYRGTLQYNDSTPFISMPYYQSMQCKGQYVYSRYCDVSMGQHLYSDTDDQHYTINNDGTATAPFIFNGYERGEIMTNGIDSDYCVHINHPDVVAKLNTISLKQYSNGLPILNSKLATLEYDNSINSTIQLAYNPAEQQSHVKIGFAPSDKYMIGRNTVGSYLFLAPNSSSSIHTATNVYNKGFVLKPNDEIRIPIIFQSRMTDYYGAGDSGTGRIGGVSDKTNLYYQKRIGLDIFPKNLDIFSFDIIVDMLYQQ